MRKSCVGALAALLLAGAACAEPSDYLKCDGKARGITVGEGLARMTVMIGTMGLAGAPEGDSVKERLFGAEGVAACTAALDGGRGRDNEIRHSQLLLARAIHEVEAKNYEAALADARAFPAAGGSRKDEAAFRHSFLPAASEIEAAALLRMGKPEEAEQAAIRMAAGSPYDVVAQSRALRYVGFTRTVTPAETDFYLQAARVLPQSRLDHAQTLEVAGDYAGAAAVLDELLAMLPPKFAQPQLMARAAVDHQAAHEDKPAAERAAQARTESDRLAAMTGGATDAGAQARQDNIARTDEMLDFVRVLQAPTDDARKLFGARSRWLAPPPSLVAETTARLAKGQPATALSGALARDPAAIRKDAETARLTLLTSADADRNLWAAVRPYAGDGMYEHVAANVWNTDKSRLLQKRNDDLPGETIFVSPNLGVPALALSGQVADEAVLLHSALLAKSRGQDRFAILVPRLSPYVARVLIGSTDQIVVPKDAWLDATTVVMALGKDIARPQQ